MRTLLTVAIVAGLLVLAWLVSIGAEPVTRDSFLRDCGAEYSKAQCHELWLRRGAR